MTQVYETGQIRGFAGTAFRLKSQNASPFPSLQVGLAYRFHSYGRLQYYRHQQYGYQAVESTDKGGCFSRMVVQWRGLGSIGESLSMMAFVPMLHPIRPAGGRTRSGHLNSPVPDELIIQAARPPVALREHDTVGLGQERGQKFAAFRLASGDLLPPNSSRPLPKSPFHTALSPYDLRQRLNRQYSPALFDLLDDFGTWAFIVILIFLIAAGSFEQALLPPIIDQTGFAVDQYTNLLRGEKTAGTQAHVPGSQVVILGQPDDHPLRKQAAPAGAPLALLEPLGNLQRCVITEQLVNRRDDLRVGTPEGPRRFG